MHCIFQKTNEAYVYTSTKKSEEKVTDKSEASVPK